MIIVEKVADFRELHTDHRREFEWADRSGCGFSFPCDASGCVEPLNELAEKNFALCLSGKGEYDGVEIEIIDKGHIKYTTEIRLCQCKSGLGDYWLYDCHHIALCLVCSACEKDKRENYQPWVFTGYTDADVECPIEPEPEVG